MQRWRVLRKTINVSEKKAVDIVRATVVLRNWLQKRDMKQPTRHYVTSAEVDSSETDSVLDGAWNSSDRNELPLIMARPNSDRQSSLAGKIRQKFASHFVSPLEKSIGKGESSTKESSKYYTRIICFNLIVININK